MSHARSLAMNEPTRLAAGAALAALALTAGAQSGAQSFPNRPIRVIVPNTAGSATDIATRLVAQKLAESMGQQTVVDNRAGASGLIGHEIAMKATPDGYTVLVSTSAGLVLNPMLTKVTYDPIKDFVPISLLVISPQMLFAHMGLPAKTVDELVTLARAQPGKLNCASPGWGTSNHLGCEMIMTMANVKFVHVPYKGTAPAISDVVGGQVQFMFNSMPAIIPLVKAGKLRAIAHGGTKRSPAMPDLPLVAETLPGFQTITWYAMVGPRGMSKEHVARFNAEIAKMYNDPVFSQRVTDLGQEPQPSSPDGLLKHMREEHERWSKVIKMAGLQKLDR